MMGLEIVTPDKTVFDGEVESVSFPGSDGRFQVLKNHAPLVASLKKGVVNYRMKKEEHSLKITGGVVEVQHNRVVLLADGVA